MLKSQILVRSALTSVAAFAATVTLLMAIAAPSVMAKESRVREPKVEVLKFRPTDGGWYQQGKISLPSESPNALFDSVDDLKCLARQMTVLSKTDKYQQLKSKLNTVTIRVFDGSALSVPYTSLSANGDKYDLTIALTTKDPVFGCDIASEEMIAAELQKITDKEDALKAIQDALDELQSVSRKLTSNSRIADGRPVAKVLAKEPEGSAQETGSTSASAKQ